MKNIGEIYFEGLKAQFDYIFEHANGKVHVIYRPIDPTDADPSLMIDDGWAMVNVSKNAAKTLYFNDEIQKYVFEVGVNGRVVMGAFSPTAVGSITNGVDEVYASPSFTLVPVENTDGDAAVKEENPERKKPHLKLVH